jgi:UDP-N-acetylmuramoylalanine--D-glutamate ligase
VHLSDLRGRRVVVWGTGREGIAAIRAVAPFQPAELVAIDDEMNFLAVKEWDPGLAVLAPRLTGTEAYDALGRAEIVVRSPGIEQTHPWLIEARARGVEVTGGTALWMADHATAAIGVTGSKGKSTTTSLVSHLLTGVGRPNTLGGNIGTAVLDLPAADSYVLELSMYQCADLQHSPRVAAITALYPEHLDWSGGESEYYRDKLNIAAHGPEHVVVNAHDARLAEQLRQLGPDLPVVAAGTVESCHVAPGADGEPWVYVGPRPLFPRRLLPLVGRHNDSNLCVALAVLDAAGVDLAAHRAELAEAAAAFRALNYRMTPIEDPSGITFVDDTLSTIPEATIYAIEAYVGRPLTVIVGGTDRGVPYEGLRDFLHHNGIEATVIGMPDSGPRILDTLKDVPTLTLVSADDLVDAVRIARERTPVGGVVLLSPAAPSYGRFDNYEHRSRVFRQAIADTAR